MERITSSLLLLSWVLPACFLEVGRWELGEEDRGQILQGLERYSMELGFVFKAKAP